LRTLGRYPRLRAYRVGMKSRKADSIGRATLRIIYPALTTTTRRAKVLVRFMW